MNIRRLIPLAICGPLIALVACTPAQIRAWQEWHAIDPAAAEAFANQPEIQEQLQQQSPARQASGGDYGKWAPILQCESGGNWHIETGNGFSGGLQFANATWRAYGGQQYAPRASQAEPWQQIDIAERVLADVGWRAWPACSRRAGYR